VNAVAGSFGAILAWIGLVCALFGFGYLGLLLVAGQAKLGGDGANGPTGDNRHADVQHSSSRTGTGGL